MLNAAIFARVFWSQSVRASVLQVLLAGMLLSAGVRAQQSTSSYVFSTLAIGASTTQTQTLTIPSAVTLGGINVSTQGAANMDFTNAGGGSCAVGTAYAASATCTVSVTFTPKLAGTRYGAVVLTDNSGNVIATDLLAGVGTGPQVQFLPGTEITVAESGLNMPGNLVVDGSGNLYFYDVNNNRILKETWLGNSYTQSTVFGGLTNVGGLAVDGAGNFYIAVATDLVKETWNGSSFVQSAVGSGLSNNPNGISVDSSGNIYIADVYNGRVVKETLSAGTYTQSTILTCGGGGQSCPSSVAVDGNGNVFVTAYDSSQIIELTPSGGGYTQSTIDASLTWPSSIVVDGMGNLYIADTLDSRAVKMTRTSSGYVQSTVPSSAIDWPWGIAVDQYGNVYISDTYNNRVLKEDLADAPSVSFATTPVGGTSSDSPQTVQILNYGNAALAFTGLRYPADFPMASGDASACTGSTSLGAGQECDLPIDFTPLNAGSLLSEDVTITDNALNITGAQQSIAVSGTSTGSIVATHLSVSAPANVGAGVPLTITVTALDASGGTATGYTGMVSFSSTDASAVLPAASKLTAGVGMFQATLKTEGNQTITAHDAANSFRATSGTIDVGATPPGVFPGQSSVNFGSQAIGSPSGAQTLSFAIGAGTTVGSIAVVTQGAPNLDFTQATGTTCTATTYALGATCVVNVTFTPGHPGSRYGGVELLDGSGNLLALSYVQGTGMGPQAIFADTTTGIYLPSAQSSLGSGFIDPQGVAVDGNGNIFVADWSNNGVKEILAAGGYTSVKTLGSWVSSAYGVAVDGSGNVFVADYGNNAVKEIVAAGGYTTVNTLAQANGNFNRPNGVAVDGSGNVFVADSNNSAVKEILAAGGYTTVNTLAVANGNFLAPRGVAVDGSGNVFVADAGAGTNHDAVKEILAAGGYATVRTLGSGFDIPFGVAVDGSGNVFVSDTGNDAGYTGNNAIKEIVAAGGYTTVRILGSGLSYPRGAAVDGSGNVFVAGTDGDAVWKLDYADPPSLNFPTSTAVGSTDTTDGTQTVQIQNIGNQALALTGLTYPADFPMASGDTSACTGSTSLGAGQECDLPIDFTPLNAGSLLSEDVTITDNALNVGGAQQSVAVSGTETTNAATHFSVTTTGSVVAGSPFTITVSALNSLGNTAITYDGTVSFISSDPLVVNPGPLTLAGGVGQTTMTLKTAGMQSITATDTTTSSLTGSGSFAVAAGPAVSLTLSNVPAAVYAHALFPITVTAFDVYGNQATGYSGTVRFSSTDPSAVLPAATTLTVGTEAFSASLATAGNQTITATDTVNSNLAATSSRISVAIPYLVVTTANDDAGAAANCSVQIAPGTGTDAACSLRDALLESASIGTGTITFDATAFAAAQTITLANGTLSIPSNTSITGSTTGAGAMLTNLLTVSGARLYTVFTVGPSATHATLSNLTISNGGSAGVNGDGINNQGSLTVTDSTFTGNTANGAKGGAIFNSGVLTVTNSTFTGNTAHTGYGFGGAIFNLGSLTANQSTFTGNQSSCGAALFNAASATATLTDDTISGNAGGCAGGIDNAGTLSLTNTIVSGNAAGNPDLEGSYADNGGNQVGVGGIKLAPLGSYGGPTQTMVPLPGSQAICAGVAASVAVVTDQRGFPFDPACPFGSLDAGAVQSNYALSFTAQPPATATAGQALLPDAVVGLSESGAVAAVPTSAVRMTDSAGLLGGTTTADLGAGSATFNNLVVSAAANDDLLTATLALAPSLNITTQSSGVQVSAPAADTLFAPRPGTVLAGPEVTFSWSQAAGATGYSLWIGSTGAGSSNVYDSGERAVTSLNVGGLPTNGATLYVRLNTITGKISVHSDYMYTTTTRAAMTTPAAGSVLSGASVTFTWSASTGATGYSLWLGTAVGLSNLYDSGEKIGTSATASGLPINGDPIHVRLYTTWGNVTLYNDYVYTAQ